MFIFLGGPPGPSNTRDDKKERVDEKGRMDGRGEDGASSEDWLHESQVSEARPGAIVCC